MANTKYYGTGRRKNLSQEFTLYRVQVKSQSIKEILMSILVLRH